MNDLYNLRRFVDAQANVYLQVQRELDAGLKETHWMWYIFPQLEGLGSSAISKRFAIRSLAEARAYIDHPVLGWRLRESTKRVLEIENRSIDEIFGFPDDRKFKSSMTLFAAVSTDSKIFIDALQKFFNGERDPYSESGGCHVLLEAQQ